MKYNKSFFPRSAVLEISNICNLRCIHCYLDKSKCNFIDLNMCLDVIDQLNRLGCFKIVITGGEVFLHKDILFKIVKKAKEMDFEVTVITNFTLCTYEDIRLLKDLGLDNLNISIYGKDSDSYLRITGTTQDVSELREKVLYSKQIGINVTVLSAGINSLYPDLLDLQEWCRKNELPFNLAFVIYGKESGCQLTETLSEDEMIELLMRDTKVDSSLVGNTVKKRSALDFCSAGAHTICIAANGNVYPCANWRVTVGSIFESPLIEIWNNSKELVRIRQSSYIDFECSNCEKFDLCPVCPGINYSATGNAHKPSLELCKYTSAIYKCRSKKQTANIEEKLE